MAEFTIFEGPGRGQWEVGNPSGHFIISEWVSKREAIAIAKRENKELLTPEITAGQRYLTETKARFTSENKTLSPITILAHVEGFVIFKRDNEKVAVKTEDFTSTYLNACKYFLDTADYVYKGFKCTYGKYGYTVQDDIGLFTTRKECRVAINEFCRIYLVNND